MNNNLTQKERLLLEDQKKHEEVCIQKYNSYAEQAQDPELKQLFTQYAQQEQQHYNTIDQILQGNQPSMSQGQTAGQGQQAQGQGQVQGQGGNMNQAQGQKQGKGMQHQGQDAQTADMSAGMANQGDESLCSDMLMTEKFVSGAYDTAIFECADLDIRHALQHIQKEEQQHGEGIFNYMRSKGMYKPAQ